MEEVLRTLFRAFLVLTVFSCLWVWLWLKWKQRKSYGVVNEGYQGLKYTDGKFIELLAPGRYQLRTDREYIRPVFMGQHYVSVPGQDILTAEQAQIKVSLLLSYAINDPVRAMHEVEDVKQVLYWQAQLALREAVLNTSLDDCLQNPLGLQEKILPALREQMQGKGLGISSVALKDIMLSGELKRAYNKVLLAQKEAQASIEKARGEQATLRSLSNAARQLHKNPALQQLRWLHTFENSKTPHTVHLHLDNIDNTDSSS